MLPYMKYATNNLQEILNDEKGAICIYCLKKPLITKSTSTTDISTVICPLCGIDAVVPQSIIQDNTILLKWHEMGFGNN
jgi:hypothetical protein|tara:strand:+ start:614 stop:850 length:237 start_codon:yes stop_codon:yes gene_type:complete